MRSLNLRVVFSATDRRSCYAALHGGDASQLFAGLGPGHHFCRVLQLRPAEGEGHQDRFVGWAGDAALEAETLELAAPFAQGLGLAAGDRVAVTAVADAPVAQSVMLQPSSVDDYEVVELQASFIEEHLLEQIAVLGPGMVFPAWVHGNMPVQLRVDPADGNTERCFLLGRDSELAIESRRRARPARHVSVFDGGDGDGARSAERRLQLRVLRLDEDVDTNMGFLHQQDLERLGAPLSGGGCLLWLEPSTAVGAAAVAASDDGTAEQKEVRARRAHPPAMCLLRAEASPRLGPGHVVLGACFARYSGLPQFGLVQLSRCRHVPVYVPQLDLVPVHLAGRKGILEHRLVDLFADLLQRLGELALTDGTVLQLRESRATGGGQDAETIPGPRDAAPTPVPQLASHSQSSECTDLYEGLSDIEDIYQAQGDELARKVGQCSGLDHAGVYEVDLALDCSDTPQGVEGLADLDGDSPRQDVEPPHPQVTRVCVRYAVTSTRAQLMSGSVPPYVSLTPAAVLDGHVKVSVAWPGDVAGSNSNAVSESQAMRTSPRAPPPVPAAAGALASLLAALPGSGKGAAGGLGELLRLVEPPEGEKQPLQDLEIFHQPASALRRHLLANLGQYPGNPRGKEGPHELIPAESGECGGFAVGAALALTSTLPGGVAVLGATGSGKTSLCRRVLGGLSAEGILPLEVACAQLGQPTRKFQAVQDGLRELFRFACWYSPSVVFLDDLGALCPEVEPGAPNLSVTEERSPILAELLLDILQAVRCSGSRVALLATMPEDTAVHRTLWQPPALEHRLQVPPPKLEDRPHILRRFFRHRAEAAAGAWALSPEILEGGLDEWAGRVDGFSVADLARLVDRACLEASVEANRTQLMLDDREKTGRGSARNGLDLPPPLHARAGALPPLQGLLAMKHLERARQEFVPAGMADQSFLQSSVTWQDVGGLREPKQELLDMLTMPTKYAALVDKAPVASRKGLMLVGPPGCGKTLLVNAAANETRGLLRFLVVKGPELLSKYIGASEAGVRQVFARAAAAAPCVIFFDEIEALAPRRGGDSTGVTDRVVNQMLTYLDGVEDRGRVFVLGATGRPDLVDAALMRPGRFDKICYCGLPTEQEKLEICEILARKYSLAAAAPPPPAEEASLQFLQNAQHSPPAAASRELRPQLEHLVSQLPRLFTAADLNALFSSARIEALHEAMSSAAAAAAASEAAADSSADGVARARPPPFTVAHLHKASRSAKASVSEADEAQYERVFAAFRPKGEKLRSRGDEEPRRLGAGTKVALA